MACLPLIPDATPWHGPLQGGGSVSTPELDFGFMVFGQAAGQAISGTSDVKILFLGVMGRNISFVTNGIQVTNAGYWLVMARADVFGTDVTSCTMWIYKNGFRFAANGYTTIQFNATSPGYATICVMQVMNLAANDKVHIYLQYSTNNVNHAMREGATFAIARLATNATVFGSGGSGGGSNPPSTGGSGTGGPTPSAPSPTGSPDVARFGSGTSGAGGGPGHARG